MTVRPLWGAGSGFFAILREAARSDVVLVQRRLLSPAKLGLLRRCARRMIYDVDDAVFLRDSNSVRPAVSWRRRNRFRAIVAACDGVIAGNNYLARHAARWSRGGLSTCIPTCVDPAAYHPAADCRGRNGLRLAWIGSSSTLPSLSEIASALSDANKRLPGLELHVICDQTPDLPGVKVVLHSWSSVSEAADLARCDAGVSWLPDHPWSRGKCGLKVLQYMAAGLPVVVNSVGIHREIVSDGVQGRVVHRPDEVAEALMHLAGAPDVRRQMGLAGRQRVSAEYSVKTRSGQFVQLVQSVAEHAAPRKAC